MKRATKTTLAAAVACLLAASPTWAYHGGGGGGGGHGGGGGGGHGGGGGGGHAGGGGGGGFRGGGGGGFRGGGGGGGFRGGGGVQGGGGGFRGGGVGGYGGARPAFNRTPSYSSPGAFGNRGGFNRGGNFNSAGNFNRGGNNFNGNGGWGGRNAYYGNHQGWMHGNWNGNYGDGYGWRNNGGFGGGYGGFGGGYGGYGGYGGFGGGLGSGLGMGLGMGMGWGLSSWMFGPTLNNWGYSSYSNPYYGNYGGGVAQQSGYDYSQPLDPSILPAAQDATTQSVSLLDQGRDAFRLGNYPQSLSLLDQALGVTPNDPTLHEFRALCLFAMARYDEAAAALYAVLSVGPGWDWTTLISLYGDPETYTQQLRALETYCNQNPQAAPPRFLLAYHYLTEGHAEAAVGQFRAVLALQPKDEISAHIVEQLVPNAQNATAATEVPPSPGASQAAAQPAAAQPAVDPALVGKLEGAWVAKPNADTAITLSFPETGKFVWKVSHKGKDQSFEGTSNFESDVLTMVQTPNKSNVMVGNVLWKAPNQFQFKVLGGGPSDPGLTFSKTQ